MNNITTIDADRVQSLFDSIPASSCPDCHKAKCICDQPKRKGKNKAVITAELKLLREQKRVRALQALQKAFKEEELPLCRFN